MRRYLSARHEMIYYGMLKCWSTLCDYSVRLPNLAESLPGILNSAIVSISPRVHGPDKVGYNGQQISPAAVTFLIPLQVSIVRPSVYSRQRDILNNNRIAGVNYINPRWLHRGHRQRYHGIITLHRPSLCSTSVPDLKVVSTVLDLERGMMTVAIRLLLSPFASTAATEEKP